MSTHIYMYYTLYINIYYKYVVIQGIIRTNIHVESTQHIA